MQIVEPHRQDAQATGEVARAVLLDEHGQALGSELILPHSMIPRPRGGNALFGLGGGVLVIALSMGGLFLHRAEEMLRGAPSISAQTQAILTISRSAAIQPPESAALPQAPTPVQAPTPAPAITKVQASTRLQKKGDPQASEARVAAGSLTREKKAKVPSPAPSVSLDLGTHTASAPTGGAIIIVKTDAALHPTPQPPKEPCGGDAELCAALTREQEAPPVYPERLSQAEIARTVTGFSLDSCRALGHGEVSIALEINSSGAVTSASGSDPLARCVAMRFKSSARFPHISSPSQSFVVNATVH